MQTPGRRTAIGLGLVLLAAAVPSPAIAGKLDCSSIIRVVDRHRRQEPQARVDITMVARELDQDVRWIERCMYTYGRKPLRPAPVDYERKEEDDEAFESQEAVEIGREETGQGHDESPDKPPRERQLKIVPPPTPRSLPGERWPDSLGY